MTTELRNVEVIETNEAYQKVLHWFFSFPNIKFGLNQLAEKLRISKTTAKIIVQRLIEEEFLIKEVVGKTWRIYCNFIHSYNRTLKVGYNLSLIGKSGIIEEIHRRFPNFRVIILFGSYRKGEDTEKSDIDIAMEVLDNKDFKIEELGIINKLGYRKNVKVNLHIFSKNKINVNLFSNIANGIVLDGFLEVKR